jgi:hypothetical protein
VSVPEDRIARSGAVPLDCGHRIQLPWGAAPELAAAVVLRHRTECPGSTLARRELAGRIPWSVRRLEASP